MKKATILLLGTVVAAAALAENINVGPLLSSKWNQISPYTNYGPVKPIRGGYDYENHMVNGCVAVAYSQILRYWGWPEKLEEDVSYTHLANATPGYEQMLPAGTEFHWDEQLDDYVSASPTEKQVTYLGLGQIFTAMITEMKFNLSMSGVNLDRAVDNPYFCPGDTVSTVGQKTFTMYEDLVRESIVAGAPLILGMDINYEGRSISHAIVGDGWKKSGDSTAQIHLNYGWGGKDDGFQLFNQETSRFIANHKPRPMVVIDPVSQRAALPVKVSWHFPKKGYEDDLAGFTVNAYEVASDTYEWSDDFETEKGVIWGEGISVRQVADCGNATKVLRLATDSNRDNYTWPMFFLGEGSVISLDIRSDYVINQKAYLDIYEAHRGWKPFKEFDLNSGRSTENNGWTSLEMSVGAEYANKAVSFRIRTAKAATGSNYRDKDPYGIQIDNVKVTNVRRIGTTPVAKKETGSTTRAASFGTGLESGKTYMFEVVPHVKDGVTSRGTATQIVEAKPETVRFYGVSSVRAGDPQFEEGHYRKAYIGLNQFAVYGSTAMTKLRAVMSLRSLLEVYEIDDTVNPGAKIDATRIKSVADATEVVKIANGKFLVKVDFSRCGPEIRWTREVLTLEGEDDLGNVVRKVVVLHFSEIGSETAIATDQVPDFSGAIPAMEDDTVIACTVTFDANGGTGTTTLTYCSGDAVGKFPNVTNGDKQLLGWYTANTGGDQVFASQKIVNDVTYYAHWEANTTPGDDPDDPDDPDEPVEETPVVTTTFPKSDDAGPNDDTTAKTRFCPGVKNTSSGVYDVTRTGSNNYLIPSGNNLLYWWIDRYKTAHDGALPGDYAEQSTPGSSDSTYTLQSYTYELLDKALKTTLPVGTERTKYFPPAMNAVADWQDSAASDDDKLKALGRHIYAALANGPVGIHISTFKVYGAVIWGCEYVESIDGNYATALYITDTVLNTRTDTAVRKELKMTSNNYNSGAGLLNFNGSTSGIIEYLYPISGPEPESTGGGEVTVKVTAGGKEFDISKVFSKVEKGAGNAITYTLDATPGKKIDVDGEQISIQPEFANDDNESPFEILDGKFVFKVKSIPGLKYQVLASDSLDPGSFTPAGKEREATGTRRELTVTRSGETKGFFKVRVSR